MADRYVQSLTGTQLAIECSTERTPDARQYHVFDGETVVGSFKKLPEAQKLFTKLRDESGWKPPETPQLSPEEMLTREREMHQRIAHLEYWTTSHKFRGGGRPKRK